MKKNNPPTSQKRTNFSIQTTPAHPTPDVEGHFPQHQGSLSAPQQLPLEEEKATLQRELEDKQQSTLQLSKELKQEKVSHQQTLQRLEAERSNALTASKTIDYLQAQVRDLLNHQRESTRKQLLQTQS